MPTSLCNVFAVLVSLSVVPVDGGADEDPPDYRRKPLASWIADLTYTKDAEIWQEAQAALGPEGPYANIAVAAMIEALRLTEAADQEKLCETLAAYGPPIVPQLMQALSSTESRVRSGAASTLGMIRPRPKKVLGALAPLMKDSNAEVRAAAIWGIVGLGKRAEPVIPNLVIALRDDDAKVQEAASYAFSEMGEKAAPALPALIDALQSSNTCVRGNAAGAIGTIGPRARGAVRALVAGFQTHEDTDFVRALGQIGPEAREAVPVLRAALKSKKKYVRCAPSAASGPTRRPPSRC
jgi:HEAT repeat protein